MEIRDLFRLWREKNFITQIEAADLIGISKASYNRFEKYGIAGLKVQEKIQDFYKETLEKEGFSL